MLVPTVLTTWASQFPVVSGKMAPVVFAAYVAVRIFNNACMAKHYNMNTNYEYY